MMENIWNPRAQEPSLSTASAIKQGSASKQGFQYLERARLARMWEERQEEDRSLGSWDTGGSESRAGLLP